MTLETLLDEAHGALKRMDATGPGLQRDKAELHCAAVGLMLLAKLGAHYLAPFVGTDYIVAVSVDADCVADVKQHADLLRRLGWWADHGYADGGLVMRYDTR